MHAVSNKPTLSVRYAEIAPSGDILKLGAETMAKLKEGKLPVARPGGFFDGMLLVFEREGRTLTKLTQVDGFRLPIKDGRVDAERYNALLQRKLLTRMDPGFTPPGTQDPFSIELPLTIGQVFSACQLYGLYEGKALNPDLFYKPLSELTPTS